MRGLPGTWHGLFGVGRDRLGWGRTRWRGRRRRRSWYVVVFGRPVRRASSDKVSGSTATASSFKIFTALSTVFPAACPFRSRPPEATSCLTPRAPTVTYVPCLLSTDLHRTAPANMSRFTSRHASPRQPQMLAAFGWVGHHHRDHRGQPVRDRHLHVLVEDLQTGPAGPGRSGCPRDPCRAWRAAPRSAPAPRRGGRPPRAAAAASRAPPRRGGTRPPWPQRARSRPGSGPRPAPPARRPARPPARHRSWRARAGPWRRACARQQRAQQPAQHGRSRDAHAPAVPHDLQWPEYAEMNPRFVHPIIPS